MTITELEQVEAKVLNKLTDQNITRVMENDDEMYLLLVAYTQAFSDVSKVFSKLKKGIK